jgi:hypothetical protein
MAHRLSRPIQRNVGHLVESPDSFDEVRRHFNRVRFKILECLSDVDAIAIQQRVQLTTHRRI